MDEKQIERLLSDVRDGKLDVEEAVQRLRHLPFEDMGFAKVDHHRTLRCGFPEVIYCPGKTEKQVAAIFKKLAENISDLEEWMMIRARIQEMSFVKKLKLESISRNIAKITISR